MIARLKDNISRTTPHQAARWLSIWCLALAVFSGNFSLTQIFPDIPLALNHLLDIRTWAFMGALAAGIVGFRHRMPDRLTLIMAAFWLVFAAWANMRTFWLDMPLGGDRQWETFLLTLMILTGFLTLDSREQGLRFLHASVVITTTVAFCLTIAHALAGAERPWVPFYASRTFIVGAFMALFMAFVALREKQKRKNAAYLFAAVFLAYAESASIMRAAQILTLASMILTFPFLIARRQWQAMAVMCLCIGIGFGANFLVNLTNINEKFLAYRLLRTEEQQASLDQKTDSIKLCEQRIAENANRELSDVEKRYTCDNRILVSDNDARIRLLLHAYTSNRSLLFGSGLDAYGFYEASRANSPVEHYRYPHNLVMEVFHATGLLGLGLMGLSLLMVLSVLLSSWLHTDEPVILLMAIPFFIGLTALVGGDLYDSRLLWLSPLLLEAISGYAAKRHNTPKSEHRLTT